MYFIEADFHLKDVAKNILRDPRLRRLSLSIYILGFLVNSMISSLLVLVHSIYFSNLSHFATDKTGWARWKLKKVHCLGNYTCSSVQVYARRLYRDVVFP